MTAERFHHAYPIEYSSRQLRDFTIPAMRAEATKTDMGVPGHAFNQNHGRPSLQYSAYRCGRRDAHVTLKASHIEFRVAFVRQI